MDAAEPTDAGTPPAPDTVAAYRDALGVLIERCLASVRAFSLPEQAEPIEPPDA